MENNTCICALNHFTIHLKHCKSTTLQIKKDDLDCKKIFKERIRSMIYTLLTGVPEKAESRKGNDQKELPRIF